MHDFNKRLQQQAAEARQAEVQMQVRAQAVRLITTPLHSALLFVLMPLCLSILFAKSFG